MILFSRFFLITNALNLLFSTLDLGIAIRGNQFENRKDNGLKVFFFWVSRRVVFEAQKHRKEISTRAKEDDARTLIVLVEV